MKETVAANGFENERDPRLWKWTYFSDYPNRIIYQNEKESDRKVYDF